MSKKTKKIPPLERIAISLDSIDGNLRRMADAYSVVSLSSQRQVELHEAQVMMSRKHLRMAEEHAEMVRMIKQLGEPKRPWWKKLLGMA